MVINSSLHCPSCHGIDIFQNAYTEPITGTTIALFYHCGGCTHSWQVIGPDARQPAPVTLRPMKDRRTRPIDPKLDPDALVAPK